MSYISIIKTYSYLVIKIKVCYCCLMRLLNHNNTKIHDSIMWDCKYFVEYSSHSNWMWKQWWIFLLKDKSFLLSSLTLFCCCCRNVDRVFIASCSWKNETLWIATSLIFQSSSKISCTSNAPNIFKKSSLVDPYQPQLMAK